MKVYFDQDADMKYLEGKTVSVIGYGSQGRAQAHNLRDSGVDVVIGARKDGNSWKRAREENFKVLTVEDAAREGDVLMLLVPDMVQPGIYRKYIEPNLRKGMVLDFAHGFNIHFKLIKPPDYVDVVMVAPKSPGPRVREKYLEGFGVPSLVAVHQDYSGNAKDIALALARGIGSTKAGVIETTFKDETESDLIGEQTVLVGGLIQLIKYGFENLVELGYPPELAYFEACNEAKLITDLIYEKGFTGMLRAVSDTAKYGGLAIGPQIIDERVKANMKKASQRVRNGEFAQQWVEEYQRGSKELERMMKEIEEHEIERVGRLIRVMSGLEK